MSTRPPSNPSIAEDFPARTENCMLDRPRRQQQILVVFACTALTFTACGLNFAFGVWQEHYETLGPPFQDASPGDIDLIGILAGSIMMLGGPVASYLVQTTSPRFVAAVAGVLFVVAGVGASLGTRLIHFQLSQGVLQGFAACLAYIPAVTVPPCYIVSGQGLATGIVLSGTGLGGVVWAPLLRALITAIGFRSALAATGLIAGSLIISSASLLSGVRLPIAQPENQQTRSRRLGLDALINSLFKSCSSELFVPHAVGTACQAAAYFLPIHFFPSFARSLGLSNTTGARIIAFSNLCNFAGKIAFGYIADRLGKLKSLALVTLLSALATFAFIISLQNFADIKVWQILCWTYAGGYGLTAGAYVSLLPAALVEQFGVDKFTQLNGTLYMIRGLGMLFGASVGAHLVKAAHTSHANEDFYALWFYVGFCFAGAFLAVAYAWTKYMVPCECESDKLRDIDLASEMEEL